MRYVTKYIEVKARLFEDKEYIVTLPDDFELMLPRSTFELLFRPAQSDESRAFNDSLGVGRIDLKTPVPAKPAK